MKLPGWEERLDALIEDARTRAYCLGKHDCFSFACNVVASLTGTENRFTEFHGKYATKEEAIALISSWAPSFNSAFDQFGFPRIDWKLAKRGDLVSFKTSNGDRHLGICLDERLVGLGPEGLLYLPMSIVSCAWNLDA